MSDHKGLPVSGYQPQTDDKVAYVNENKRLEEIILRRLDDMMQDNVYDHRWTAIARTQLEQGFMAMNRAVFRPARISNI